MDRKKWNVVYFLLLVIKNYSSMPQMMGKHQKKVSTTSSVSLLWAIQVLRNADGVGWGVKCSGKKTLQRYMVQCC